MLKNKKKIILFGIILVAIFIFINPTESNAAEYTPLTIESGDAHSTITSKVTITNWADVQQGILDTLNHRAELSDGYAEIIINNTRYYADVKRELRGIKNGQNITYTGENYDEYTTTLFDNGTDVEYKEIIDLSSLKNSDTYEDETITFTEPGEYSFQISSRITGGNIDYEMKSWGNWLGDRAYFLEYALEDYKENYIDEYTSTEGKFIIANELDSNDIPTGNLEIKQLYIKNPEGELEKHVNPVDYGTINTPQIVIKVYANVSGNLLKSNDTMYINLCGNGSSACSNRLADYGEDYIRYGDDGYSNIFFVDNTGYVCMEGLMIGDSTYSEMIQNLYFGISPSNQDHEDVVYGDFDNNCTYSVKINGIDEDVSYAEFGKIYELSGDYRTMSSSYSDTLLSTYLKKNQDGTYYQDEDGNFVLEIEINGTNSGTTSYTGIAYNILPFAIVIILAGIGIMLTKKTSSKKGGARYE